jgi:manganese-dependent inorganic pyrophosphatase
MTFLSACGNTSAGTNTNTQGYKDLITSVKYGDDTTYVIGHKSPDSDTVGSAIAYAYLLNQLGVKAEAAVSEEINGETKYALETFGVAVPNEIKDAAGKQFVLVDHSTYSQTIDNMDSAKIVGIIDHHGIGEIEVSDLINVRSAPVGAAASLVYLSYKECGVAIPEDMAKVMLMSILSDTRNMKRDVTAVDQAAYDELVKIAKLGDIDSFYQKMAEAIADYGDMTDEEIFYSDYKEYTVGDYSYGIADVVAFGEDNVRAMADRMYEVAVAKYADSGLDFLYAKVKNEGDNDSENKMYTVAYGEGAVEVLQEAIGGYDGSKYFIHEKSQSRKKVMVPAIDAVLEKR